MRRIGLLDQVLLALLVPLWAVCFALSLRSALGGVGTPSVVVSARGGAEGYPTVSGIWLQQPAGSPLRIGDRLIRLGDSDLRGVGALEFLARAAEEAGREPEVAVVFDRDGVRGETSLRMHPHAMSWPLMLVSSIFAATGLLLFLRSRTSPLVTTLLQAFLCLAILLLAKTFGANRWEVYVSLAALVVSGTLLGPLTLQLFSRFPGRVPPTGLLARIGPWFFAAFGLVAVLFALDLAPYDWLLAGWYACSVAFAVTVLLLATRSYRDFDPIVRRQTKWVLLGVYCAVLTRLSAAVWWAGDPSEFTFQVYIVSSLALALIPLALLFAGARYNLFDIDRLLSATAAYNVVVIALVGIGLAVVPRIGELVSSLLGVAPRAGQAATALALAAVVVPAAQRLRPRIDRVFFKEKYTLDRGIGELLTALTQCADAREVTKRVGEGLVRLFRPEACAVYAAAGESFEPIFVEGRAVPPAFAASSPLVSTLRERSAPLALSDAGRRPDEAALGPFDRAALQTLEAEVVVPVHREALAAFLCLGPKRSGDVYTSTDLSLLRAVAETVSHELRRFDQDDVIRQSREMQESLRRYVPGAVAEQLASGSDAGNAQREVSVLFVDIRGYTSFSESHRADEVFSTVNRYTDAVSAIVARHAGAVVEFHGDGLLAVFGAPRELAHKERAAVEAGREIVDAVGALPGDGIEPGAKLSVGIGIATGEDFVGDIQAAERRIWTVIGNTTNLAARLQALTRELDAAIAIDETTHAAAGYVCADFAQHEGVRIRGRREPRTVWALPLGAGQ